jgi:hypothetical protein
MHQPAMRRRRSTLVPAHAHAPAQRVHDLRQPVLTSGLARRQRPAPCLTHQVSEPRHGKAGPALTQPANTDRQLPDLASVDASSIRLASSAQDRHAPPLHRVSCCSAWAAGANSSGTYSAISDQEHSKNLQSLSRLSVVVL